MHSFPYPYLTNSSFDDCTLLHLFWSAKLLYYCPRTFLFLLLKYNSYFFSLSSPPFLHFSAFFLVPLLSLSSIAQVSFIIHPFLKHSLISDYQSNFVFLLLHLIMEHYLWVYSIWLPYSSPRFLYFNSSFLSIIKLMHLRKLFLC